MPPRPRFVAVDAPFLIALSQGDPACEAAVDFLTRRLRSYISVPPATMIALFDIIDNEKQKQYCDAAKLAERSISSWGFICVELNDLQDVYAKGAVKTLVEKTQIAEALCQLIAEASVLKCAMLITDHPQLYNLRRENLEILLMERDLDSFSLIRPAIIAEVASEMFGF
jgi:hypothetical protein